MKNNPSRHVHTKIYAKLKSLARLTLETPIYFIAQAIPKKPEIWVFGSWFGNSYSDNPKYVFEEIQKNTNYSEIKAYWIYKNKEIPQKNQPGFIYCYSLKGIAIQLRAGAAFISQNKNDLFRPAISRKTLLIQLWHGVPLKKIGYDARKAKKNKYLEQLSKALSSATEFLFPFTRECYGIISAASEYDARIFSQAFRTPIENVHITGYPRNDRILLEKKAEPSESEVTKIIYMPTFRGEPGSSFDLFYKYGFDASLIDQALEETNSKLFIKLHPTHPTPTKFAIDIKSSRNIKILDNSIDIYEEITSFDMLITDYSSIYVDFLLLDKHISLAQFDLDEYLKNSRDSYISFEKLPAYKKCKNWNDIKDLITEVHNKKIKQHPPTYLQECKANFHHHTTPCSSIRVLEKTKQALFEKIKS